MLKIALVLVKNVFFGLKKGISELMHWVAPKHTAIELLEISQNSQENTSARVSFLIKLKAFWSIFLIKLQACNFIKKRLQKACNFILKRDSGTGVFL